MNYSYYKLFQNKHQGLFVVFCLIILYSCECQQHQDDHEDWTSSKNRNEQVLFFTKVSESDFYHRKTFAASSPDKMQRYISAMDFVKVSDPSLSAVEFQYISDSIARALGIRIQESLQVFDDCQWLGIDFLGNHSELAYNALLNARWRDSVSIDLFKEYLLPYKLAYEVADNWRDTLYRFHHDLIKLHPELENLDSLYAYHMTNTYYGLKSAGQLNNKYPSEPNFSWLAFSKEGDCGNRCRYMIYHLRAAGAPATYDYIPNWGNRPYARHAYVGLAHRTMQLPGLLENTNDPNNLVNDLNAAMHIEQQYIFDKKAVPKGLYVQYEKTIPKIYRETWLEQKEILNIYRTIPHDQIDMNLIKPNMIDVTAQYLITTDIEIRKPLFNFDKIAYLATFDLNGWIPVAFSKFNIWGKAQFNDMGKNILYMPMVKNHHGLEPIGDPFIVENNGKNRIIKPDHNNLVNMHLVRKFPFFSYTAVHAKDFKGCIIEGANKSDFSDAITIHSVDYYPFYMHRASIFTEDSFRYIRFRSPSNEQFRMAQMECYSGTPDKLKKLENILYTQGILTGNDVKAFDGDLSTDMVRTGAVFDFGSPQKVTEIRFCPRNDTNCIIPGNEYELFYWDNEWVSVGRQIATDYHLNYNSIPSKTMYWLRCHTEGREERIFTYENDMQIWW